MMCPVLILKINITLRVIEHKTHLPVTLMRGQVIHMKKKILFVLTIVLLVIIAGCIMFGCNRKKDFEVADSSGKKEVESKTIKEETKSSSKEVKEETTTVEETTKEETTEVQTEEAPSETQSELQTEPESVKQQETDAQVQEEPVIQAPSQAAQEQVAQSQAQEATQEQTPVAQIQVQRATASSFVSYDPNSVAALANQKLKAKGFKIIPENLNQLLAEGKISKEIYDECYLYDGCGYYSVFVEMNLLEARTMSGRSIGSVDEIATYLTDMLSLETEKTVYVEYQGIYNYYGTDLYEFRCYR